MAGTVSEMAYLVWTADVLLVGYLHLAGSLAGAEAAIGKEQYLRLGNQSIWNT